MDLGLAGARIAVTGGSRGIGRATVELLLREGATVATCARDLRPLDDLVVAGASVDVRSVDVTADGAVERWVGDVAEALGGLDGVVSNVSARVHRTDLARWAETFEVDLLQHVRLLDAALPALRTSGGLRPGGASIVVVSSIAASLSQLPEIDRAYGPMKAALTSYAAQLAQLEGRHGVRVNAVAPGPVHVDGGFWDQVRAAQPAVYAGAERLSVLGRLGRPDEIAAAIAFLLAPVSSFTTAATLHVDGGAVKAVRY